VEHLVFILPFPEGLMWTMGSEYSWFHVDSRFALRFGARAPIRHLLLLLCTIHQPPLIFQAFYSSSCDFACFAPRWPWTRFNSAGLRFTTGYFLCFEWAANFSPGRQRGWGVIYT
jgi:hypothetical protein